MKHEQKTRSSINEGLHCLRTCMQLEQQILGTRDVCDVCSAVNLILIDLKEHYVTVNKFIFAIKMLIIKL